MWGDLFFRAFCRPNFPNVILRQAGLSIPLSAIMRHVGYSIAKIIGLRAPTKIAEGIVVPIVIRMRDNQAFPAKVSKKSRSNKNVNVKILNLPARRYANVQVSSIMPRCRRLDNPASLRPAKASPVSGSHDAAKIADFIVRSEGDCFPVFHASIDSTRRYTCLIFNEGMPV